MDLLDLFVKVVFDSSDFDKGIKSISDSANAVQKTLTQTLTNVSNVTSSASSTITKTLTESSNEASDAATSATTEIAKAAQETGKTIVQVSTDTTKRIEDDSEESAKSQQEDSNETRKKVTDDQKKTEAAHEDAAKKSAEHWRKAGEKIKSALKTAAKVGAAALAAAGTATIALVKQSVDAYGEYEQLVGGVEKLYGESATKLQQYAQDAFKTAGMSANTYMQNVTGFSASLINSLGNDTDKAVEIANQAMKDISDNANTFGKYSVEELAQVYQALAKENYQTLDNLMLGFGGTKEGMQQLIEKAESLNEAFVANRDENGKLTMSFADMVQAIHIVQEDMNIAGTTSKEAAGTIQGSMGALTAAWQNLITALADPNADLSVYIDNVVQTAVAMGENMLPAIEQALKGVSTLVEEFVPIVLNKVPTVLNETLPNLLNSVIKILEAVISTITENADRIADTAVLIVDNIAKFITNNLPLLVQAAVKIVTTLAKGLSSSVKVLLPAIADCLEAIINTLTDGGALKEIIDAALILLIALAEGLEKAFPKIVHSIVALITGIVNILLAPENLASILNAAALIVISLGSGIVQALPDLLTYAYQIIGALVNTFITADWNKAGSNVSNGIWEGLQNAWTNVQNWWTEQWGEIINFITDVCTEKIPELFDNLKKDFENWVKNVTDVLQKFPNWVQELPYKIGQFLADTILKFINFISETAKKADEIRTKIIDKIVEFFKLLPEKVRTHFNNVVENFKNFVSNLKNKIEIEIPIAINKFMQFFKELPEKIKNIGKEIVEGLKNGITNAWNGLTSTTNNLVNGFVNVFKSKLKIASPSKVFKQIGKFTAEGFNIGFTDEYENAMDSIEKNFDLDLNPQTQKANNNVSSTMYSPINLTLNIDKFINNTNEDINELTQEISYRLQAMANSRGAVFA